MAREDKELEGVLFRNDKQDNPKAPDYRGRGLGHVFFDEREAQALRWGAGYTGFCAVIRPEDHPLRSQGARGLGGFWQRRGYRKLAGTPVRMSWRDVGDPTETEKELAIWVHEL